MPSSPSQSSDEPHGLVSILLAFFSGALLVSFLSGGHAPDREALNSKHIPESTGDQRESRQYVSPSPIRVVVESLPPTTAPPEQWESEKKKDRRPQWWMFGANVVTFLAVVWYAGVATQQRNAMITQNKITTDAFRIDERAWIGLEPVKPLLRVPRSGKFGAGFDYELYLRNTGKTVARCVEIRAPRQASQSSVTMGDNAEVINNIQNKFLLGKYKGSEGIPIIRSAPKILAPGQITTIPLAFFGQEPQVFPKDQWVSYLVGRVDYIDEFGVRHWVKFCFFVTDSKGNLGYCKYGNDEDTNPEIPPQVEPTCPVT